MKKTKLVGILTSLSLILGAGFAAFGIGSVKAKEVKADNPVFGTASTNFAALFGDNDTEYKSLSNPASIPMYVNGETTSIITAEGHQGTANEPLKLRDYTSKESGNYYLYIKYNKDHEGLGSDIIFSASGNYLITSLSSLKIKDGASQIKIYYSADNTVWAEATFSATNSQPFTCEMPVASKYVKIANNYISSTYIATLDLSVGFLDSTALLVSFDSQGGTEVDSQYVLPNSTVLEPIAPTKASTSSMSYSFAGWHTDPENESPFDFVNTPITENITLYAHWDETPITSYTITFDSRGGTAVSSQTIPNDGESKFTKPSNPTREKDGRYVYTFKKWCSDPDLTTTFDFNVVPTSNVTVYAAYSRSGDIPTGYTSLDFKRNSGTWATDYKETFQSVKLYSRETFDTEGVLPSMSVNVVSAGNDGGMKIVDESTYSIFAINNSVTTIQLLDPTKYFTGFIAEFVPIYYNVSKAQTITLSTGGVSGESGLSPCDSYVHSDLVLIGSCGSNTREFSISLGRISNRGVRLRYAYATFGIATDANQVINFGEQFNDADVCGTNPNDGLNATKWANQETIYGTLSAQAKSDLTNYEGSNAEVLECLERYDEVVKKHGVAYDFMGRVDAGKISLTSISTIATMSDNNSIIIVAVVSLVSLTAIGGFFFYRKRKEN